MRKKGSVVHRTLGKLFQTSPSLGRDVPAGSREGWLWDGHCGRRGFGTHSWLQQDECSWHLPGLALRMGKTNKQVCSKTCRRNDISLGRAPLLPQGKKNPHPVREQELPVNGRKLNGRTASAGLFFAFCQEAKKKLDKEMKFDSRYSRPKTSRNGFL